MERSNLVIVVTGTPGSGKSSFANELTDALPDSRIIELNDIVDEFKLFSSVDKMGSKVVKLKDLESKVKGIMKETASTIVFVGHIAPEITINPDITVVTRVTLKELI